MGSKQLFWEILNLFWITFKKSWDLLIASINCLNDSLVMSTNVSTASIPGKCHLEFIQTFKHWTDFLSYCGLALFCTFGGISWLLQYRNSLRKNVLTEDEQSDGWTSEGRAWLGFSYFFVIIALLLFVLNILLVYLAVRPCKSREPRTATDKNPEGVIMLYWLRRSATLFK